MNKTLAALVLGIGALGAGCTETRDNVAEGAKNVARQGMVYVAEVNKSRVLQEACAQRFPLYETRAFVALGLGTGCGTGCNDEVFMKICCVVERHEHKYGLFNESTDRRVEAGYCTKM